MAVAAEWFIDNLAYRGVEWIASLTGNGLEPLLEAANRAGLRSIETRNEQTASYIAESYGRLTRSPGVCFVSSGMGHVNALSGVAAAWFGSTPMLLVSGAGDLRTAGLGHYQDMQQAAVAAPITKYSRVIDRAERTRQILAEAFERAEAPPPGPVHLTFPLDVQRTEVDADQMMLPVPTAAPAQAEEDVEDVARLLAKAERPLIVAGSGMYWANAGAAFREFVERFPIPVVVPIWDRGVIDGPLDCFMGVIGASSGGPRLLADADCIVMAGAAPDYRVGFLQPPAVAEDARVVYFEHSWERQKDIGQAHARARAEWLEEARRRRDDFRRTVAARGAEQAAAGTHAVDILSAVRDVSTEDTCLLIDGGNIGQWAHHSLCDRYPGNWLTNGPSGTVGWGIGGAMGARLAYPESPVLLVSGDGAFTFNLSDLESAVRQKLHFVALVADDQGWGIMKAGLGPIAFAQVAEGLGARAITVNRCDEIRPALLRALGEHAVTVIHVPIIGGAP
jgi:acetolactate synthase I/II/III large subunit